MKTCLKCDEEVSLQNFYDNPSTPDGKASYCKSCSAENSRASSYRKNYGITIEQYDRMFEAQGGRCNICKTDDTGNQGRFQVDHCHDTGRVRGLLCKNCNVGLGHFKDNILFLSRAIEHLQDW